MTVQPAFRHTFKVMDYSQKLYLTNFSSEKTGGTYYYSPLDVYPFGIFDVSTEKYVLHPYVCRKIKCKKVVKNSFFCQINHFKDMVYFSGPIFKDISFSCRCMCRTRQEQDYYLVYSLVDI